MKSLKRNGSKALLLVFLLLSVPGVNKLMAAPNDEKRPLSTVQYVGKEAGAFVFDVRFGYGTVGRFRIVDEFGNVLFDEKVQPIAMAKRFKISADDATRFHFESITKEGTQRKTFVIAVQVEEKINVVEVK
jgi:hypothetical protein